MALRSPREAKTARRIGMSWMVLSLGGAIFSGIVGVAYIASQGIDLGNAETVVLIMAQTLLHPLIAGLVLAAVLAAIMSTVSSQLIVCSSALVEDLYKVLKKDVPADRNLVMLGRVCVLVVSIVAIVLAINPNDTILGLVSFAWAGFGAAFGPLIILSLFWRRLTNWGALAGMFVGAAGVFIWDRAWPEMYELLPAFLCAMIVAVVVSLLTYKDSDSQKEIQQEFTDTGAMLVVNGVGRAGERVALSRRQLPVGRRGSVPRARTATGRKSCARGLSEVPLRRPSGRPRMTDRRHGYRVGGEPDRAQITI
nr:hypothetical protein [Microbacterium sp. NIBRBAC000506063]